MNNAIKFFLSSISLVFAFIFFQNQAYAVCTLERDDYEGPSDPPCTDFFIGSRCSFDFTGMLREYCYADGGYMYQRYVGDTCNCAGIPEPTDYRVRGNVDFIDATYREWYNPRIWSAGRPDAVWDDWGTWDTYSIGRWAPPGTSVVINLVPDDNTWTCDWRLYHLSLDGELMDAGEVNDNTCTAQFTIRDRTPLGNPVSVEFGHYLYWNVHRRPTYTITGNVFDDLNKNALKDGTELNYTGAITTNPPGAYVNGQYTISGLLEGTYTVQLTSPLPTGYRMVYPTGAPPSFQVTVGPSCFVGDATTNGSCDASGNVINLNFAISNSFPWVQTVGLDTRIDAGYSNQIPPSATVACGGAYSNQAGTFGTHGVTFVGSTDPYFGYGQASPDPNNWIVGGINYPSRYRTTSPPLRTSYASVLAAAQENELPINNLQSVTGCSNLMNCNLPNTLAEGIYRANSNVNLINNTFFQTQRNIVILVNGTLTISGDIRVPQSSTALFIASGNIDIATGVGGAPSCGADTDIEGYFSADRDIIVRGNNFCRTGADQMLRVGGTMVANASLAGGSLLVWRDICGDNIRYPTVRITARPDFILNMPNFLRKSNLIYRELAP